MREASKPSGVYASRMINHAARWAVVLALLTTMTMSGCQSAAPKVSASGRPTTASTCSELAARIVDAVQSYVDSFADVKTGEVSGAVSARQSDFLATTKILRDRGAALGCTSAGLADSIRAELGRLVGGTPVQDAVANTFRADPLGSADPSDAGPSQISVRSAEELVAAVARAGSGSTITLAAGTYALETPLVALRPITLSGAGDGTDPGRTSTITSSATGATLIASTSGNLALNDLAVEHSGSRMASVVAVASGGYRFERVQVSGAVAEGGAGGFGIVLRSSSGPLTPTGDIRTLTDVRLDRNVGGGVVVAGTEQPALSRVHVTGSAGCGICWVENAGGTAVDVSVERGAIGLRIDNAASPRVSAARVSGAEIGVALSGSGSPSIEDSLLTGANVGVQATGSGNARLVADQVTDARETGIRLSGSTRTTLEQVRVSGATRIGIATVGHGSSTITGGQVSSTGEVGLVWGEDAIGTASDVVVRGPKLGVQLSASATGDLSRLVVDGSQVALLAGGQSSGVVTGMACGKGSGAAVVLTDSTSMRFVDSPTCLTYRR